jgi:hypothetical protein
MGTGMVGYPWGNFRLRLKLAARHQVTRLKMLGSLLPPLPLYVALRVRFFAGVKQNELE